MKDRPFYFLVGSMVLAFIVVALADSDLRSRTGLFDPSARGGVDNRPGVAALQLLPDKSRAGFLSMEYLVRARDTSEYGGKMVLYIKAAGTAGAAGDKQQQARILREAVAQCPASAETIRAWLSLAEIKLAAKPPQEPRQEIRGLVEAMEAIDIQSDHPLVPSIRKLSAKLTKHKFHSLARALKAATPEPRPKEADII